MPTHVAFLRAINLGRHRRLPMVQVQEALSGAGFTGVESYLATGNVRVETPRRSARAVESEIEQVLGAAAGFDVPVVVLSPRELRAAYDDALALDVPAARKYLTLLKEEPPRDAVAEIDAWEAPGEGARVLGRAVLWWIDHPNADARMSNARLERRLGTATTRDLKVVATLAERWGG